MAIQCWNGTSISTRFSEKDQPNVECRMHAYVRSVSETLIYLFKSNTSINKLYAKLFWMILLKRAHRAKTRHYDCPHHIGIRYPMTFNFQLLNLLEFIKSLQWLNFEDWMQSSSEVPTNRHHTIYDFIFPKLLTVPHGYDWSFMEFNYRIRICTCYLLVASSWWWFKGEHRNQNGK